MRNPLRTQTDPTSAIADALAALDVTPPPVQYVIPGRYPFTYAYDFACLHQTHFERLCPQGGSMRRPDPYAAEGSFDASEMASRADAAGWLGRVLGGTNSTHPDHVRAARMLADAYIETHGHVWPDGITADSCIADRALVGADGRYNWNAHG